MTRRIRRGFGTAAAAIIAAAIGPGSAAVAGVEDAWAWKHRVLVVFAPDESNRDLELQRQNLTRDTSGLADRHMSVVEVVDGRATPVFGPDLKLTGADLSAYARKTGDAFEVMLFGKDTGLKLRSAEPVSINGLFALIDTMPMRRQEMRLSN